MSRETDRERWRGKKKWKTSVTGGFRGGGVIGIWEVEVCLRTSTAGSKTHTPNHASAKRAKWKRLGGNETENETPCWWGRAGEDWDWWGPSRIPASICCSWKEQGRGAAHCCLGLVVAGWTWIRFDLLMHLKDWLGLSVPAEDKSRLWENEWYLHRFDNDFY